MIKKQKVYEVIGYAYEADVHCLECSERRFSDTRKFRLDDNEVQPVFLGEVTDYLTCGDCYAKID